MLCTPFSDHFLWHFNISLQLKMEKQDKTGKKQEKNRKKGKNWEKTLLICDSINIFFKEWDVVQSLFYSLKSELAVEKRSQSWQGWIPRPELTVKKTRQLFDALAHRITVSLVFCCKPLPKSWWKRWVNERFLEQIKNI